MKMLLALIASALLTTLSALAGQTLIAKDAGVSIVVPDNWIHDDSDQFGYVIRPKDQQKEKIRIHLTGHKGVSPAKAVELGATKVNEMRKGRPPEEILLQTPVKTKSGLTGEAAEISNGKTSYLTRIYFEKPDGRIFCVCVYHYGDMKFVKDAKRRIVGSLQVIP